jgi:copper chaperone CopZ
MKKFLLILLAFLFSSAVINAQITKASLQASGLTCALCSKSIYDNLKQLSFVDSVDTDLNASVFLISFKPGSVVDLDMLNKKVGDAGFSIASLRVTALFSNKLVENDSHVSLDGQVFHFVNIGRRTLNEKVELTIIDKHFVSSKEFKRYSSMTSLECIKAGKAASCCNPYAVSVGTRIYHVTI